MKNPGYRRSAALLMALALSVPFAAAVRAGVAPSEPVTTDAAASTLSNGTDKIILRKPNPDLPPSTDTVAGGGSLVYLGRVNDRYRILLANPDGGLVAAITDDDGLNGESHPTWSADGSVLVYRDAKGRLRVSKDSGRTVYQFSEAQYGTPWVSGDGARIVAESRNDVTGSSLFGLVKKKAPEIYAIDLASGKASRLTDNAFDDTNPAWSPGADRIAFVSNRDGKDDIYSMASNGSDVKRLTRTDQGENHPAWSPDGASIAFSRDGRALWVMNADGTRPRQLATTGRDAIDSVKWSPDGGSLYVSAGGRINVVMANNGAIRTLCDGTDPSLVPIGAARVRYDLSGQVTKPFGDRGVSYAGVRVTPLAGGFATTLATDENGQFRVPGLDEAVRVELIAGRGYNFIRRVQDVVPNMYSSTPASVSFEAMDDRFQARGTIKYGGFDGDGTVPNLRGVRIRYYHVDPETGVIVSGTAYTNSDGTFSTGMVRGTVIIVPELQGWGFQPAAMEVKGSGQVTFTAMAMDEGVSAK